MAKTKKDEKDPLADKVIEGVTRITEVPFVDDGKKISFEVDAGVMNMALMFIGKHMKKTIKDSMDNVHIVIENNTLKLHRTDLHIDITASIPCLNIEGNLLEFLINADKLQKIVGIASVDKLGFEITRKEVTIAEAWNTYVIPTGPKPEEYPKKHPEKEFFKLDIPAKEFKQILTDASEFCAQGDGADLRQELSGVCMQLKKGDDCFYFVSTNLNALYHNKIPIGGASPLDCSIVLPIEFVNSVIALSLTEGTVTIHVTGDPGDEKKAIKNVWLEHGKYNINGRLIDAKYPAWEKIIPANQPCLLTVDRAEFTNAVTKFIKVLEDPTKQLRLIVNSDHIMLQSNVKEVNSKIEMKMDGKFDGELTEMIQANDELGNPIRKQIKTNVIGLNANYVKNAATIMTGKTIYVSMEMSNRSVIMKCDKPEDKSLFVLIMPLMLNK